MHLPIQAIRKDQLMRHLYSERLHWMLWPIIEGAHIAYKYLGN